MDNKRFSQEYKELARVESPYTWCDRQLYDVFVVAEFQDGRLVTARWDAEEQGTEFHHFDIDLVLVSRDHIKALRDVLDLILARPQ